MGLTSYVALQTGSVAPLPETPLVARRSVIVENCGPNPIWVSSDSAFLEPGKGHEIAPGASREFPSCIIYGTAETASQDGTANNVTVVSEVT